MLQKKYCYLFKLLFDDLIPNFKNIFKCSLYNPSSIKTYTLPPQLYLDGFKNEGKEGKRVLSYNL